MLRHVLAALHIDGVFRLDAEGLCFLSHRGLTFEQFVDRAASEFQVLLDLIAGDELRGTHGIEGAGAAIGGQGADIDLDAGEVFDGVLVFAPVEPTHRDLAAGVGQGAPRVDHGLSEGIEEVGFLVLLRLARPPAAFRRSSSS